VSVVVLPAELVCQDGESGFRALVEQAVQVLRLGQAGAAAGKCKNDVGPGFSGPGAAAGEKELGGDRFLGAGYDADAQGRPRSPLCNKTEVKNLMKRTSAWQKRERRWRRGGASSI
jgi:hypothetical protein